MKALRIFSRIFVGLVFVFSGFTKIIDPLGSEYKFVDYFTAMNINFLDPFAFPLAILLCAAEFALGILLVLNIKTKVSAWGALAFMVLFTPVTLWLAITNKVHDCGCFGDALVLTNWETFYKNIVILVFVFIVFFTRKQFQNLVNRKTDTLLFYSISFLSVGWAVFNTQSLPVIDFRPYKVGTNIPESMAFPENAPQDVYETIFWYAKDGVTKEFTMENYPWQDSTWKFVDSKSVLIKKGYEPPIHNLTMISVEDAEITGIPQGDDILPAVLQDINYNLWIVVYDLEKASLNGLKKANEIAKVFKNKGYNVYCLTGSNLETINTFKSEINPVFYFFNTDKITLKTIVRSNPGFVLVKNGYIENNWHYHWVPSPEEFENEIID